VWNPDFDNISVMQQRMRVQMWIVAKARVLKLEKL
jgi:hypothetical protein